MVQIAKLSVDLFAKTAKFDQGLSKAGRSMKDFKKTVKTATKVAAGAFALVGGALAALGIKQAGVIDETAKLSRALGVNIREFQALALVASEAGITQDQLGNMITKSQRSIIEAGRGLQTYARSFETLGLNVKDLLKLSPDEQFLAITNALEKVENPTLRTATALEIFGRSGRQVINMLGDMGESVEEARQFNDRFGVSLSGIDAAKVEEANDAYARIGQVIAGVGNTVAIRFAPAIVAGSEALIDSSFSAAQFGKTFDTVMMNMAGVVDMFRISFLGLRAIFKEVQLGLDLFILDSSKSLYDLSSAISKIPFLQGQATKAQQMALGVNIAAQKSASKNADALEKLSEKAGKYVSVQERLAKVQKEMDERTSNGSNKKDPYNLEDLDLATNKTGKLTEAEKERKKALEESEKAAQELGMTFSSAFEDAVIGGAKFSDVLKGLAQDIQRVLFRKAVTEPLTNAIGGLFSGGGSKSKGGGIFSSIGSSIASVFSATGYDNLPRDMMVNVHKGESILSPTEAKQYREGKSGAGGSIINIDARGAEAGVEQKIRNVMNEVQALRKEVPSMAVSSVASANKRNPRLLNG